jgi:hypothetical protein
VLKALEEVGYNVADLSVEELLKKKILFRQHVTEVDIHPHVAGATFEHVWRKRIRNQISRTPTSFAGLADLIKMKNAAGRTKDLEDMRVLRRLLARKRKARRKKRNGHR